MNETEVATLGSIFTHHMEVFRTGLFVVSATKLPLLKIDLTEDARSVHARRRNKSKEQGEFLRTFDFHLLRCGLV